MKLRTKLIVAFMSVMILPMIFLNVVMHTFASREVGELQQLYMIVVFITTTLLIIGSTLRFLFRWRNCRRRQEISRKGILILRSGRSRMMRSDNSVRILRR